MKNFSVIFDMDGVLLDTEQVYMLAWTDLARRKGIDTELIRSLILECTGTTSDVTRQIMKRGLGDDFPFEESYADTDRFFDQYVRQNGFPVKPYARELLSWLHNSNIMTGLASSTREAQVRSELSDTSLLQYLDVVLGGDHVEKSKPEPDIYLMCASKMGAAPKDCYVIEDSYNGIRAAHAAHMHPIMVPDLREPDDEIRAIAEHVLPSLKEVKDLFQDMI